MCNLFFFLLPPVIASPANSDRVGASAATNQRHDHVDRVGQHGRQHDGHHEDVLHHVHVLQHVFGERQHGGPHERGHVDRRGAGESAGAENDDHEDRADQPNAGAYTDLRDENVPHHLHILHDLVAGNSAATFE